MRTWLAKSIAWVAPLGVAAALCVVAPARASDLWMPAGPTPLGDPGNFFEARFGVFAHGIGSAEQGTVDLNGSVVTPRIVPGVTGVFSLVVPRVHLGGAVNLSDRTSFGYTGFLWTIPVWDRFFAEAFVGPAVHNGSLTATPVLAGLGCPVLFHSGA